MKRRLEFISVLLLSVFVGYTPAQSKPDHSVVERLSNANFFAIGPTGFAGRISQWEIDYRAILSQPDALDLFERVYVMGNAQAKAYALTGVRQLSRTKFDELYAALPASNEEEVTTMSGCIVLHRTLRDVAKQVASSP